MTEVEEQEVNSSNVNKDKQRASKGVDSVTDYVEDKSSESDAGKATAALQSIASSSSASNAIVKLKEEDVKVIMEECEISKESAELYLRHFEGDLHKTLTAFVRGETITITPYRKKK